MGKQKKKHKKDKIDSPMMDYLKKLPVPSKDICIKNAINDTLTYKKISLKKHKQLAKKVVQSISSKDLADYTLFKRVKIRDKLKKYIHLEIKKKKSKKTKKKSK